MTGTAAAPSPQPTITRGMLVTILYRLEDEPAVTAANPFTDVSSGSLLSPQGNGHPRADGDDPDALLPKGLIQQTAR